MRWIRTTLQLMLRSPVRFSVAILLLGCLDAFVLHLLPNKIPGPWTRRLGMFVLPLAWVVIAALARGADNSRQNWKALSSLTRPTVWMAALAIGLGMIAVDLVIQQLLFPGLDGTTESMRSGRVLDLTSAQAWLVTGLAGICFFPLLVLEPALSFQEVLRLSKSASEVNGRKEIRWLILGLLLVAAALQMFAPAYGLTVAVWLVFVGVLNYVAYRDIFEGQSANLPKSAAAGSAAVTGSADVRIVPFVPRADMVSPTSPAALSL
jgi:hypothetical protein